MRKTFWPDILLYYKFNTLLISIFFEKTPLIKRDFKINNYICQKLFKENFCKINSFHRKTEQIMKKTLIFMIVLFPIWVFSQNSIQWSENFSDGEFSNNPAWSGTTGNFIVNPDMQLQSNALTTSRSYLSTPSEAFDDATWEFWVRMNYNPSSSNYALVHIISDKADLSGELNGYYVQIGNTADEISLYRKQVGSNPLKLIDGADGTVNSNPVIVKVKVTRSKDGTFALYRQRLSDVQGFSDTDFVQEGASVNDTIVKGSRYFGVSFVNSSTTGKLYFFDDISVKGDKFVDVVAPEWTDLRIIEPDKMVLTFSEPVNISSATFLVDNGVGSPSNIAVTSDESIVTLTFNNAFEKGKIYSVDAQNIKDFSGNPLKNTYRRIGVIEAVSDGDVVINEILFDNPDFAPEYFEVYNNSPKTLDMSKVFFATRNTSGGYTINNFFPNKSILLPHGFMALTSDVNLVRNGFAAPDTANIVRSERWSALSNSGAGFLVGYLSPKTLDTNDTIILDEVRYDAKWHHSLIRNPKGVSLERINPRMPSQSPSSWHSAAKDVNYGTPGYKNSQFREMTPTTLPDNEKWFYPDPEAFTPDNDGIDDVSLIRYKTDAEGFTANVIIFNAVGVKVTQLANNHILGNEGYLVWDGKTDRGINVNPGIYVLYVELVNAGSGVKKIEKMPIVVSAR